MSESASTSINTLVTAAGTACAARAKRLNGDLQNLNTEKLYVKKGPNCSATDFSYILAPDTGVDSGYGGPYSFGGYTGEISVYSATSVRCIVSEDF